ncbi:hypothetical protein ACA910_017583 [Epithemia clementina (nom. ined.)]
MALSQSSDGKPRVAVGSPWKTVPLHNTQLPAASNMENGHAVDLDGGILIVGIPGYNNTGVVALYRYIDGEWQRHPELVNGQRNVGDEFGVSLALQRIPESDGFTVVGRCTNAWKQWKRNSHIVSEEQP